MSSGAAEWERFIAQRISGLDREVAVKIINAEVAANTDNTQRFAREARLMANARHPRAAMIYDSGTLPDGRLFIVMEYVEGITLADILKKEGKISVSKSRRNRGQHLRRANRRAFARNYSPRFETGEYYAQ